MPPPILETSKAPEMTPLMLRSLLPPPAATLMVRLAVSTTGVLMVAGRVAAAGLLAVGPDGRRPGPRHVAAVEDQHREGGGQRAQVQLAGRVDRDRPGDLAVAGADRHHVGVGAAGAVADDQRPDDG